MAISGKALFTAAQQLQFLRLPVSSIIKIVLNIDLLSLDNINVLFPSELFFYLKAYSTVQGYVLLFLSFSYSFKSFNMDLTLMWDVAGLVTDKPIN